MDRLRGKVALVTGGARGIGLAVAELFAAEGATTIAGDITPPEAPGFRGKVEHARLDVSSPEDWTRVVDGIVARHGGIDILVNNAGLTRDGLALRMKDEDWQRVIDVDLTAAFRLARAALKGMMRRRWGRIVSITSIVGVTGNPGQANYAAAKAGLIGMSKALAAEMAARSITVNCVAPGFITSPMTDVLPEAQRDKLKGQIPAGRLGSPADIAAAVAFLASEEAGYVTGLTLHVNGGMAMI